MENMLKIAIPNKGRLSEKIYDLLNKAGLNLDYKDERKLSTTTKDGRYSIIFVRTQDIPKFLDAKVADIGITGFDIVEEENLDFDIIKDFGFIFEALSYLKCLLLNILLIASSVSITKCIFIPASLALLNSLSILVKPSSSLLLES